MVAAVTDLSITQEVTGSPVVTLEFGHDGVDLQAFLVQRRPTGSSDPWASVDYFVPGDVFDSSDSGFDNYAIPMVAEPGFTYRVLALGDDQSVST
ncbi:MAG: hypothetical protein GEU73_04900 [Chloroflexi bacterium]|nr:hypothetical protein [Chloroflexota bacterium]